MQSGNNSSSKSSILYPRRSVVSGNSAGQTLVPTREHTLKLSQPVKDQNHTFTLGPKRKIKQQTYPTCGNQ